MEKKALDRRSFLKNTAIGGAVAVTTPYSSTVNADNKNSAVNENTQLNVNVGYLYLNLDEQAFIETVVDHMIPADELSPKGTDIGINIYIDRALAEGWGKGERLYMQGPWKKGLPNQGYQLPLTPAELYRAGISDSNAYCRKNYLKNFEKLSTPQREEFLLGLQSGKVSFDSGLPAKIFFEILYQNVIEGMFADPIYGGNRNKAGWKLIGFPGVVSIHAKNVEKFLNKKYLAPMYGIADLS